MSSETRVVTVAESGGGPYGQAIAAGRHELTADEPADKGGQDSGPTAHELLMASLGACTTITVRMYAQRKEWKIEHLACEVRNERIEGAAPGAPNERFIRRITVRGDLTQEQRKRLLAIAGRCPISQILIRGAVVESELA